MTRIIGGIVLLIVLGAGLYLFMNRDEAGSAPQAEKRYEIRGRDQGYFESKNGYYAHPAEEGNFPGIVIVHDGYGLDGHTRGMAEQLATRGFRVFAVDLFGETAATSSDVDRLTGAADKNKSLDNIRAAVQYLRDQGVRRVGVIGLGFGGSLAMQHALSADNLDATVIYYGTLDTDRTRLRNIDWPVLGIFGEQDQRVPVASVREFENSLKELRIESEVYVYPERAHGFAHPMSGPNYSMQDAQDAFDKTAAFLNSHLR